jgi:hypothetical protein
MPQFVVLFLGDMTVFNHNAAHMLTKTQKIFIVFIIAISLSAAGWFVYDKKFSDKAKAYEALFDGLNDSDSAKLKNVEFFKSNGVLCGYVNAKNRMGAYVGFTQFIASKDGQVRFEVSAANPNLPSSPEYGEHLKKRLDFYDYGEKNCK